MRVLSPLLLCLCVAACTTPELACQRRATADLRTVDALIKETEETLRRGFALEREPYTTTGLDFCFGHGLEDFGLTYCTSTQTRYRQVPKAIDRRTEQRKLTELRQTRSRLARESQAALAQCTAL